MRSVFNAYFEAGFWIFSLALLATMPFGTGTISFCPFHFFGLPFCPGCGLGRSINMAFHRSFVASFQMHPLGIPSILIILMRIIQLLKKNILKTNKYEPKHNRPVT